MRLLRRVLSFVFYIARVLNKPPQSQNPNKSTNKTYCLTTSQDIYYRIYVNLIYYNNFITTQWHLNQYKDTS